MYIWDVQFCNLLLRIICKLFAKGFEEQLNDFKERINIYIAFYKKNY